MTTLYKVAHDSPQHRLLLDAIRKRYYMSRTEMSKRYVAWSDVEDMMMAYIPTKEVDAARKLKRKEGFPQYTTIEIPYAYAQLMAAHTYWTSVFLGRTPIMQYTGRHGEPEMSVQALEAIIDYQVQVGLALVPLYIWLLDAGKYGCGIVGSYWAEERHQVSEIITRPKMFMGLIPMTGSEEKVRQTRMVTGYRGNKIYNVRPYDFFSDPRVPLSQIQKGEFCSRFVEVGWNHLFKGEEDGLYYNIDKAKETKAKAWMRERGSARLETPNQSGSQNTEQGNVSTNPKDRLDYVELLEFHWELVPNDWGLGSSKRPEKWVFTIANDEVIISAQPLGLLHNQFPFYVLEYEIEGYSMFKRSMLEMIKPLNEIMTWLVNTHFYNVRKILNDQFVFDPSRIVTKDALDPKPGRMMRLKPSAYGSDPKTAIYQLQTADVTQNHLRDTQIIEMIIQRMTGVTDNIMGMVNPGGRKTATEVRTSSTFGINRLKTNSEYFSASAWSQLATNYVQTTQQRMDNAQKVRVAGDLLNRANTFMDVTPETIAGFYDFVPVDGTMPVDRFAQAMLWKDLMAQLRNFPSLMMQYDLGAIFAYVGQLAGIKNINQFKINISPQELIAAQLQAGNVVPLGGRGGKGAGGGTGTGAPTAERPAGINQVAGLGPVA